MTQNNYSVPKFDRDFLKQYSDKHHFLKALPELITIQLKEYDPYFMTITFQNTNHQTRYDRYRDYFRYFYRNLNQRTLSRSKTNYTKSTMIMIPEESYHCVSNQTSCTHFHGLLFVHHNNLNRFNRRCVLDEDNDGRLFLSNELLSPYPPSTDIAVKRSNLSCCSHHMSKLTVPAEVYKTAFYCNKNFVGSAFEYDQMMLFSKLHKA